MRKGKAWEKAPVAKAKRGTWRLLQGHQQRGVTRHALHLEEGETEAWRNSSLG